MKVLVTGSCGFIFSNFVIYALQGTKWDIVSIDKLTYAGSLLNVPQVKRHKLYIGDVCDYHFVKKIFDIEKPDVVIHGAAESVREDTIIPYMGPKKIEHIEIKDLWNRFSKRNEVEICNNGTEVINMDSDQQRALTWKNGFGQWKKIKQISRHKYSGKMINMRQKWGEIDVTPNHCIYNSNMDLVNPGADQELLSVRSITRSHSEKGTCDKFGKYEWKTSIDDLLYTIAFYVTEGCTTFNKANGSYVTEFSQNNISDIHRIKQIVEDNFDVAACVCERKCNTLRVSNKDLFYTFRKECGFYSSGKFIPSFIFELIPELQKKFIDYLVYFDGHKYTDTNKKFGTNSRMLAAQLSTLLSMIKQDYSYSKNVFDNDLWNDAYCFQLSNKYNSNNKHVYEEYEYDGWVYDLEIDDTHKFVCGLGNVVVHNSHVDNSINSSHDFVTTNVIGTHSMLEAAHKVHTPQKFINISTDEVYGSVEEGASLESDMLEPRSPYCVTPDTKVILDNGKEIDICNISTNDKITAIDIDNIGGECIKSSNLTNIFRKEYNGDILTIKTKHNVLNCTPEHKLFIKRPKRVGKNKLCYRQSFDTLPIMEIRAEELSVGDWVICPKKIDFDGKETFGSDFWRFAGYFVGDGSIHKNYGDRKSRHIRLADGDKELLGKYRDLIVKMTFDDKLFSRYTEAIKIDDNLVKDFCDQENLCIKNVKRWRNKIRKPLLSASPSLFKHSSKNCWYLKFGHKKTLMNIDKLGLGVKARFKTIPSKLFDSTNEEIAAFLAGLFDADGTVVNRTNGTSTISYSSSSKELMTGVRSLLRRFGIISTISLINREGHSWYKLSILDSTSVCTFNEKIPIFKHKNQIKWSKSQNNMQEDNIYYSVVKSISKNNGVCSEVYDIENVNEHNFIASGILVHNSSTKASADLLGQSYAITHDLPVITTRCSNNFGPRQHMEKLIPKVVTNILTREKIPLYGDGKNMREWIYVKDNFSAIRTLVEKGEPGEVYNISSGFERQNIEVLHTIFDIMGEGRDLLEYVKDRKGHDRRYSVNCDKLKALGWEPQYPFEEALAHTIGWYKANTWFWR